MTNLDPAKEDPLEKALRVVLAALPQDRAASAEEIAQNVGIMATAFSVDHDHLLRVVEAAVSVTQEISVGLDDPGGHVEWLGDARAHRNWEFWDRYRRYLQDAKLLPPKVVGRLDDSTNEILGHLEDPQRPGPWRRTGLVVGQVQSGKTGNYIGLACKAADAGYKLIVILAGSWDNLRSQTQLRVDEGILGFDTQYQIRYDQDSSAKIGVGVIPGSRWLRVASLTTSAAKGDFKRTTANSTNIPIGDYPVVLVIKKNRSILTNLKKWFEAADKIQTVRPYPFLVIDDEADNASINTRNSETEPSAVNKAIRELMALFERSAYVGYTATPFANIYIDPSDSYGEFGNDLFPESFIESLAAPSNYLGPERVFGLRTADPDEDDVEALPIFREVADYAAWMPDGHKIDWMPPDELPQSLKNAVNSFVLTCAARRARGQEKEHNSMLVHVTRFQRVQDHIADQLKEHVRRLLDRIRDAHSTASTAMLDEFKELWEKDFVTTSSQFPEDAASPLTWEAVRGEIRAALAKIRVHPINGSSKDALEYYENRRTGLSVIAVGGDKLSRGLTLEGLSVSYYLRASKAYDTLLQMGRWFGYRPGYEDLCRLYTTTTLRDAYYEITSANDELRREFEEMSLIGATPRDFGLRVRASPAGLVVTAPNKMRRGIKVRLSYSGQLEETTTFDLREDTLTGNFSNLESFVKLLDMGDHDSPIKKPGSVIWQRVSPDAIIEGFLSGYIADKRAHRVRPALISKYIQGCVPYDELTDWTVCLVGRSDRPRSAEVAGHKIAPITRNPFPDRPDRSRYTIRRVLSPKDESVDLDDDQERRARDQTRKAAAATGKTKKDGTPLDPQVATGPPLRGVRRPGQALLLIYPLQHPFSVKGGPALPLVVGFAISFPGSEYALETEYVVNEIWAQEHMDLDYDEDEDE
ncbi:Z1 domain-containing protein [Pseudofrankia sp. BMG5.37]|uniref:Z1 domain-containing protein n=1 Tax=Pseudofrankia sp. BMG5.37 TaxID=3050035 RepID=UPI002894C884|nr:Z1 domain-containing protein [Pseudofrankia sp. BMG5.37]MDT3444347.1 Z1 domain-containing protein [Pseudofrankia sp. BMG5.37]